METEQKRERDEDEVVYAVHDRDVDQEPERKKQCSFRMGNEADSEREIITSVTKIENDKVCKIKVGGKYASQFGDFALCSPEDFEMFSKLSWSWNNQGYATTNNKIDGKWRSKSMSRVVIDAQQNDIVDHINGLTFDNRRENLFSKQNKATRLFKFILWG